MDISGKYGLVTGGAEGIGKVLVENLLQKGAKGVAFLDVNETPGEETKKEFEERFPNQTIVFKKCDVSSKDQMKETFQEIVSMFGSLHIVCNNAAIVNEVTWERMFQINLNGTIYGTLLAMEHMAEGGVVINMSSASSLVGVPTLPVFCYCATKCAINAFSRNIALFDPTIKKKGIRINILCPTRVIDRPPSSSQKQGPRFSTNPDTHQSFAQHGDRMMKEAAKMKAGIPTQLKKAMCTIQSVADAMVMFIENDYNGETAMPQLEGNPILVEDCQKRFREDVLNVDYLKMMDKIQI
ncbi:15-hydroxyprostaglandin dehydrogenase [NAD(+)]-like [Amphiura filiformis]|uniref:15-hydroxyprostaglandin dehydrogenase [NAD(+)]-like n=1 Tax=Amphiura filiformis TaxID=82378 RepID=UPI003B212527